MIKFSIKNKKSCKFAALL